MLRSMMALLVGAAMLFGAGASAQPLVDVAWMKANLGKPGIVIVDVRSAAGKTKDDYLKGHIPGAVFTDYAKAGWREKDKNGTPEMLPPPEKLGQIIGSLGIDNATHVVLVPEGARAVDVGAATRLYWTFKIVGHDKVSILNGGHTAWVKEVDKDKKPANPLETADVKPAAKAFTVNYRAQMYATLDDVKKAMAANQPLVDNRPNDFFVGLTKSPHAKAAGTIPGAKNLPESWLTDNGGGVFRSKTQMTKLYEAAGVPLTGKQVNFCNTGHWASLGWFVASEIMGNKDAIMYDGSMTEWTADGKQPLDQKIKLQ